EDSDAARRLLYVAMSRARKTLMLLRLDGGNVLLDTLAEAASLLCRPPTVLLTPDPRLARRYQRLTLKDVDLGFSGRRTSTDPMHRAITELTVGDSVGLRQERDRWEIVDGKGNTIGRL